MFGFIKHSLAKIYITVTARVAALFNREIDSELLRELEIILLSADTGIPTTRLIMNKLHRKLAGGKLPDGHALKKTLKEILIAILAKPALPSKDSRVFIMVGINGSGKTTCAAKLASYHYRQGKRVLLVGADTFRAAAMEQLSEWANRLGIGLEYGQENAPPASIIFKGCERFITEKYDILIIDTAGRLHTKTNLMNELSKIKRVIEKKVPNEPINTFITIDSMIGQNSFEQAKQFKECTEVNGAILTKMDGTGKGGITFAIAHDLAIPIVYFTYGELIEQIREFDNNEYVTHLLS